MRTASSCLVALDIDGTLVDFDGALTDPVRDAVASVADAGHHVVIATGRSISATTPILDRLGLSRGFAVCSNGAVTLALDPQTPLGYSVAEAVTFDPAPAVTVLRAAWPTALIAVEELRDEQASFKVSAVFPDAELMSQRVVGPEELVSEPTTRVTFYAPQGTSDDVLHLAERIGLHGVSYAIGYSAWLDIAPEGVSKASALELIRRRLGVEPALTVAVGDQRNDIEMLRWAARGVAMGNAPQEVQDVADEVADTVDSNGLVPVMSSLLAQ
ncbi:MAG: HAD family hydrolase [Nostocoides sp.]